MGRFDIPDVSEANVRV